jgi:hypothetical protein
MRSRRKGSAANGNLFDDFPPGGGREKRRAGLAAFTSRSVDRFKETQIERYVNPCGRSTIPNERHDGGHCALPVLGKVGVIHDGIEIAWGRHRITVYLKHPDMAGQCLDGVTDGIINRVAGRNAAGHIGKADAVDAVGVFVDESDVSHCLLFLVQ